MGQTARYVQKLDKVFEKGDIPIYLLNFCCGLRNLGQRGEFTHASSVRLNAGLLNLGRGEWHKFHIDKIYCERGPDREHQTQPGSCVFVRVSGDLRAHTDQDLHRASHAHIQELTQLPQEAESQGLRTTEHTPCNTLHACSIPLAQTATDTGTHQEIPSAECISAHAHTHTARAYALHQEPEGEVRQEPEGEERNCKRRRTCIVDTFAADRADDCRLSDSSSTGSFVEDSLDDVSLDSLSLDSASDYPLNSSILDGIAPLNLDSLEDYPLDVDILNGIQEACTWAADLYDTDED